MINDENFRHHSRLIKVKTLLGECDVEIMIDVLLATYKAPRAFHALKNLKAHSWPIRVLKLIRYGVFKNGLIRNLGTFATV